MNSLIRPAGLRRPYRFSESARPWMLVAANAAILIGVLVFIFTLPSSLSSWRVGQVTGETVVAQRDATFVDHVGTNARRKAAMAAIPITYRYDPRAAQADDRTGQQFLARAQPVLTSAALTQRAKLLAKLLPASLSITPLLEMPVLTAQQYAAVRDRTVALLAQARAWRFNRTQEETITLSLLSTIPTSVGLTERSAVADLLDVFLTPTEIADMTVTNRNRQHAAAQVAPVLTTVHTGQVVVHRGDVVTSTVIEELNALGLEHEGTSWQAVVGSLFFVGAVLILLLWYLESFHPEITTNSRILLLVDVCILAAVIGARLVSGSHVLIPFFLPLAAASTFAAVLMAPEAAIGLSLAMAMLAGWVVANSFELTVFYFLTGATGVLAIRQVKRLKQFIVAGLYIAAFGLATMLAFGLVDRTYDFGALQDYVLASGFNGFASSALALGGFAVLANFFGVTTSLQLLELAQPSQPLLRRLASKAPGTYHHSLVVSNMVEQAADQIGADPLVAKISGLYHDVGKTANPHCFVENQLAGHNVHDDLNPDESARLIRGHVPQGLRLARQEHLPRSLLDGIAEHHGTLTLAYFLHKAMQEANGESVDLALYSYPGPKPQSRETALLMLADGCESLVRSSEDHSKGKIRELVDQIFSDRVAQHQLNECPMTLRDLEIAKDVFCSVLNGMYHPRIEYPTEAPASEVPIPFPSDAIQRRRQAMEFPRVAVVSPGAFESITKEDDATETEA